MTPYLADPDFTLYCGDVLDVLQGLPDESVNCVVTSPPYEDARDDYPAFDRWSAFWHELSRVVDGPALVNVGRRWRKGIERLWWLEILNAAQAERWFLVDTLVWIKPNANPIHGEVLANSHEYVLMLCRAGDRFNVDAIRRPHAESTQARFGRAWTNHRGVKQPRESRARKTRAVPNPLGALPRSYFECYVGEEKGNPHPAPMAWRLAEHLVLLGAGTGETILDPFLGSGTTAVVARKHGRRCIGIELNPSYCELAARRTQQLSLEADIA